MITTNPAKAKEYFEAKLEFTTGPFELSTMMKQGEDLNIIDVRAAEDFGDGHIPGAMNLPKGSWDNLEGLSKEMTNIIYCYSEVCHLGASAAKFFAEHDFPVMVLEGGFQEWSRHEFEIEK